MGSTSIENESFFTRSPEKKEGFHISWRTFSRGGGGVSLSSFPVREDTWSYCIQPSCFRLIPSFQILVMWRIWSPSNSMM